MKNNIVNLTKKLLIAALLLSSITAFGACPYRTGGDATHQGYWGKCKPKDYWKWAKTYDYTFKQNSIICVNKEAAIKVANALNVGNDRYLQYVVNNSIECSRTSFSGGVHLLSTSDDGIVAKVQYALSTVPRDYTVSVGWIPTAWLTPKSE